MRKLLLSATLAMTLLANTTVFVTEHGKSYHKAKTCMSLARAAKVYQVSEADALSHKLKQCGICWRVTKSKSSDWMKEAK